MYYVRYVPNIKIKNNNRGRYYSLNLQTRDLRIYSSYKNTNIDSV